MRVYLQSGDIVSSEVDLAVILLANGEHGLQFHEIPDSTVVRYWHPQEDSWYDCRWDFDSGSLNYGKLYYEKSDARG